MSKAEKKEQKISELSIYIKSISKAIDDAKTRTEKSNLTKLRDSLVTKKLRLEK